MKTAIRISEHDLLALKEQTLNDCGEVVERACDLTEDGRQQANLTCFVGLGLAASAIQCAPSMAEAELFAAHMQEQLAKMIAVTLMHYGATSDERH